jgi:hypothetical protein
MTVGGNEALSQVFHPKKKPLFPRRSHAQKSQRMCLSQGSKSIGKCGSWWFPECLVDPKSMGLLVHLGRGSEILDRLDPEAT